MVGGGFSAKAARKRRLSTPVPMRTPAARWTSAINSNSCTTFSPVIADAISTGA
jgi:hypothetical protein